MPRTRILKASFAGGELTPEMFGRVDVAGYQSGAALLRNFIPKPQGVVENRPGTQFIREVKNSAAGKVRLIPFSFSRTQSMALEFGNLYVRFHTADGTLLVNPDPTDYFLPLTASTYSTNAGLDEVTITLTDGHGLAEGESIHILTASTGTVIKLNFTYFVRNPNGAGTTFQLSETTTGDIIDLGTFSGTYRRRYRIGELVKFDVGTKSYCIAEHNGATSALGDPLDEPNPNVSPWHALEDDPTTGFGVMEVPTPYLTAELFDIHYVQSGDVLTLVHQEHAPRELSRFDTTFWTLLAIQFNAAVGTPVNVSTSAWNGSRFEILAVAGRNITLEHGLTTTEAGVALNDTSVYFDEVNSTAAGVAEMDGKFFRVDGTTTGNVFDFQVKAYNGGAPITPPNSWAAFGVLASPTNFVEQRYKVSAVSDVDEEGDSSTEVTVRNNLFVTGSSNTVAWDQVAAATKYRIYKKEAAGLYGFIGESDQLTLPTKSLVNTSAGSGNPINLAFTSGNHGLTESQAMRFEGTLPTNIVAGETYFVRLIATDLVNWNLSTTPNLEAAFVQTDGVHTGNPLNATFQNHFVDADGGIIPDLGLAPPRRDENVFTFADNFPAAVGYFEQRRVFAGTETEPHFVWMTKSGTESDLSFSLPVRDSDRIKVRALARSGSTIAHLVPLNDLIMLSNEEEFRVTSVNQDAVSPSSISIKTQTYVGASTAQPVVVNSTLIFAAARGGHLREMGYSVQANSYLTGDISLRATHLFDTLSIVDLTYAKAPQPVLWLTSSNGKLLSLTYVPEEQIGAWAQHDTDGTFETCVAVSEVDGDGNDEDFLYVVVNRDIAGLAPSTPRRYVERMVSRETQAISDSCFLDSCLTYDGVATTIIGIASSPVVDLTHLEGETVSALADGLVVTGLLVTSGTIVLPTAAAKVHIGLPYTSDLQTLPAAIQMEALGQGREKNVSSIDLRLFLSAGASVGPTVNDLLKVDPYEVAGQLRTESVETVLTPAWSVDGQIFLRQTDPLPVTVVGITMKLAIGD